MNKLILRSLIQQFFIEDIGDRDITSDVLFSNNTKGEIVFMAKEAGVFCGEDIIKTGYPLLDSEAAIHMLVQDGDVIQAYQKLAIVTGEVAALLKGERVILNLVQRMSGIATITSHAVEILDCERTRICDTRKTTPGLRMLEKYAVRCGGGYNHRFGLYDGIMIKDNHISFAGSISRAIEILREKTGHMVKIEVETESKEQVMEAVAAGADVIMFDNQTPEEIKELIQLVPSSIITEASGGIGLHNLHSYRETGVDYISLGYLTHSYRALDISVKMNHRKEETKDACYG